MQFAHTHRKWGTPGTLVVDLLTKDHLKQMFEQHADKIMMMIGLSITSPLDQFCKSTGRTIAIQRLSPQVASLDCVFQIGTKHIYHFNTELKLKHKTYHVNFHITTVAEHDEARLVHADIREA